MTTDEAVMSALSTSFGPLSGGNITRRLMGCGLLSKDAASYAEVSEALRRLLAEGRVTKAGNGKSVHWRIAP
jgi:hypothetical protein